MPHFTAAASSGSLRRPRNNRSNNGKFSVPNDEWSVPESNACNPKGHAMEGRGMERKRRLHPRRHGRLVLAYSEGGRLIPASSDSVARTEQKNDDNNVFKLLVLTDSISSTIANARSAFRNAFGSLTTKVGAAYHSKAFPHPSPAELTNSPPKLVFSISQDDDTTSIDESTSVTSLSGVSSYGTRRGARRSSFWNYSCVIIAALLLAFAHICILPKGMFAPGNSFVQDPVAMEVPTIIEAMKTQEPMTSNHLSTAFLLRQNSQTVFGVLPQRPTMESPPLSPTEGISSIAKSRAEERLKKINADALKSANLFVAVISETQKDRGIEEMDMNVSDGLSIRPGIWRLLGSYFVPALVKVAGHH